MHGRIWDASSNNLKVEERIPNDVIHSLKLRGHDVQIVDDYTDTMGHAGAILIDANHHLLMGANDPREDGLATGY